MQARLVVHNLLIPNVHLQIHVSNENCVYYIVGIVNHISICSSVHPVVFNSILLIMYNSEANMRCERNYPMGSCIIGCQNPCQVGFIPCGHVCMCSRCWERAPSPKACPMCRKLVEHHTRLFLSCVSTTQVPRDETQHVDGDSYHAKFYQHYPTLTSSQVKQEDGTVMI